MCTHKHAPPRADARKVGLHATLAAAAASSQPAAAAASRQAAPAPQHARPRVGSGAALAEAGALRAADDSSGSDGGPRGPVSEWRKSQLAKKAIEPFAPEVVDDMTVAERGVLQPSSLPQ